jgi:histidinol-phosphate aminotransferase
MNDPRPPQSPRAAATDVAARVAATIRADVRASTAYATPKPGGLIDLNANESPYPVPAAVQSALAAALAAVPLNRYPDGGADGVKAAIARAVPLPAGAALVLGNGSDELIQLITIAVAGEGACVVAPDPTFVMYRIYAMQSRLRYVGVPLRPDLGLDADALVAAIVRERPALVWIASPNNPTGYRTPVADVERVLAAAPGAVVVDEAYADYTAGSLLSRVLEFPNLVVLRTLSKIGLASVRLGYAAAHPRWIAEIDKVRSPYNVNALTQAAVPVLLGAAPVLGAQAATVRRERERVAGALAALPGFAVYPSEANFLLVRVPDAAARHAALRAAGILVKNVDGSHPLVANCLRITIGTPAENDALIAACQRPT